MINRREIEKEVSFLRTMEVKCRKRLAKLPKGKITFRMQHGKERPYVTIDGLCKYIKKNEDEYIRKLLYRKDLETKLHRLDHNIKILSQILKQGYYDPADTIPTTLEDVTNQIEIRKGGKPGYGNKHRTTTGIQVKSKSELLIYELLKSKDLIIYYEKPVTIDGYPWYPDFTIIRKKDGKVFLWEHFGMMSDPQYAAKVAKKIEAYTRNGYLPCINIFYSFDDYDGAVNLEDVENLV